MESKTIEHEGVVTRVEGDEVSVMIVSRSACSACHAKGTCGISEMKNKEIRTAVPDFPVKTGDRVRVVAGMRNAMLSVMMAYVISGLMCGLAAWMMTSRLMACDATYGDGNEMDAIAAAVIGGTSMSGGKGTLWGTIVGVFLVGFLRNALNILGVNPYWQGTAIGAVIVIAVLAEKLSKLKVKKTAKN